MTENWRILLALALTMLVLIGWNIFFPGQQGLMGTGNQSRQAAEETQTQSRSQQDRQRQQAESTGAAEQSEAGPTEGDLAQEGSEFSGGRTVSVETPLYSAAINEKGGVLEHFRLKKYKTSIKKDAKPVDLIGEQASTKGPMGLLWNQESTWETANWEIRGGNLDLSGDQDGSLTLVGELGNITLKRTLIFRAGTYRVQEKLKILNRSQGSISGSLAFTLASPPLVDDPSRYNYNQFLTFADGSLTSWDDKETLGNGVQTEQSVQWSGVGSSYFLLAMAPENTSMYAKGKYEDEVYRAAMESRFTLERGGEQDISLNYYLGPQEEEQLKAVPGNLEKAVNYGWFNVIAKPLVKVLEFFNSFTGNYGLAIILLTLVIKIVFWPLSHKSYKSMEKMKKIQPMMKELKEKYKDDRQKMNQELMQLYKTYKVNPAGGCLPMLLQIPVFIGLFEGLMGSVSLRHAPFITHFPFTDFVWLADLASKDPLYITPVLMGLSMFLQQKLSPTASDPTQAKVMMFMPIFLTFIFLNFPAGLVVYFITNNLLSIAQQGWMMRKV
ncbi:MAG: membrane protein insertase YidC [Desulfohalobiaceae bacterium]